MNDEEWKRKTLRKRPQAIAANLDALIGGLDDWKDKAEAIKLCKEILKKHGRKT